MISKFKLTIAMLLLSTIYVSAASLEYTKQVRKAWSRNSVSVLKINNKFGEIKINDTGGDSVTIKVVITVDNPSESKAKDLISKIRINIEKSGGLVDAETEIEDNFRSKQNFSIDYFVNIPKDKELNITNRYGNLIMNDLEAKGIFDISYGSMTAGKMKAPTGSPVKIMLSYGKANLESINDANLEIKYSKLYADKIDHLVLESRYSTLNLDKSSSLTLDSKYDAINIEKIDKLKSVSKYTNYKIEELTGSFDLDTGYGSVRIAKVDPKFNKISIVNSYGGINISLNELNYRLEADCDYCDVKYPEDRYKGNKIRENHRFSLDGNVGNGGGTVNITSRYGGIKLVE